MYRIRRRKTIITKRRSGSSYWKLSQGHEKEREATLRNKSVYHMFELDCFERKLLCFLLEYN